MMKSLMMRVIPLFLVIPAACVIMLLSPMASVIALAEDDDSSLAKKIGSFPLRLRGSLLYSKPQ